MIKEKYLKTISQIIGQHKGGGAFKAFIFGSCLTREKFGDLDVGVMGNISEVLSEI